MTIHLLTKNPAKIKAASSVLREYGIEVESIEKEYPEIQADSSIAIARHTAITAAHELNVPVIREDHSLFIHAWGIPGPYTSYIEKRLPVEKLLDLMERESDRTGHFELALAYATPDGAVKEFICSVPIWIKERVEVADPRGGWNGVLCLASETRAFTEYPEEERINIWDGNYKEIAKFLKRTG